MSNPDDQKKVKLSGAPKLGDMILGNLKPRVGKETTKWVAGLADEAMQAAEQAARLQGVEMLTSSSEVPPKPAQVTTVAFMDYLFDCFQQYEFEYNRSAPEAELVVSLERPTMVVENYRPKFKAPQTGQIFRGRLSTRSWTLLMRGHENEIEGWILPIDKLIAFAGDHDPFTQFLAMERKDNVWTVDGIEVSWDKVRSFAKQLFAALIHVSKTGSADGLVLTLKPKKAAPGSAAAIAEQEITYSFEEHNPEFEGLSQTDKPAPKAAPVAPKAAPVATSAAAGGQGQSIDHACQMLVQVLTTELDKLSAAGQAAFAKQDMALVQKTFEQTNKIKALRDKVSTSVEGWKKELQDALKG